MCEENKNRSKWLHLRLTEDEFNLLKKRLNESAYRKMSEYARLTILAKPIIAGYKNQSLDGIMAELSLLRKDLNGVANNFNQVVHKLHTLDHIPEFRIWLQAHEKNRIQLVSDIETIRNYIAKTAERWLHL